MCERCPNWGHKETSLQIQKNTGLQSIIIILMLRCLRFFMSIEHWGIVFTLNLCICVNSDVCEHLLGGARIILSNLPYDKHSINMCDCMGNFTLTGNTYTRAKSQTLESKQVVLRVYWLLSSLPDPVNNGISSEI